MRYNLHTMILDTTLTDTRSEKEVRKEIARLQPPTHDQKSAASRYSVAYWRNKLFRPTYQNDGEECEVLGWYVQIQFVGRREKVGLGTNNKEEACRKATVFYTSLRQKGWDAALAQLSPERALAPKNLLTIGNYIETVRPLLNVRPRSFRIYTYAFRKIAQEAIGTKDMSRKKFDPKLKVWRNTADLFPLAKLTPTLVNQWRAKVLAEAKQNPIAQQRARRNINSYVRNARALFSKKILKKLRDSGITAPSTLPFQDFEFEAQGSTKYDSKFNAREVLQSARTQLAETKPEAWKVILLALGAGLRRAEIDGLCWGQVDFARGEIHVVNHAYFQAKTVDSEGKIFVDPGLLAELGRFRNADNSKPVVNPELLFRESTGMDYYRCNETFKFVTDWLRANGVTGHKPLHTLRKEFGSIICAAADIHTASRQLRHSNLATTAAYYVDNRRRVTVPMTEMLKVEETPSAPSEQITARVE